MLVSHNMQVIENMCRRVAWLDHGEMRFLGQPSEAIRAYRQNQHG
jgi:ABC-type polysaccharide/polyol phosphate transport system ATPase subunit